MQRYPTDKTMCIFDGYASSTKDAAYFQRDKSCPEIVSDLETTCETNRNVFLSTSKNNTPLISFCEGYLQPKLKVLQARSDAVYLLAPTAATFSEYHETTLAGDDTDL